LVTCFKILDFRTLVAVPQQPIGDLAGGDFQRGEQHGGVAAFVIVSALRG
jgi:hypothetical protein